MSLVTTKDLMLDAQKNHYAIGAFNAENMEMVQAIIAAAEELRAPVIVQTTPGTLKYASPAMFHAMVAAAASEASVPVVMHLDHGSSYELAMQAFRAGYTSVMIDGSHHVFEENIEITSPWSAPATLPVSRWRLSWARSAARKTTLTVAMATATPSPPRLLSLQSAPASILWLSPSALPTASTRELPSWIWSV